MADDWASEWVAVPTGGQYRVVLPDKVFCGRTYNSWVCDWFNWFISADADKRHSGPVVNLRSLGIPDCIDDSRCKGVVGSDADGSNPYADDAYYPKTYPNDPNLRIGKDRLQITNDQVVLVPIIISYWIGSEGYADLGYMRDYAIPTIDNGDDPPLTTQLTIGEQAIKLPDDYGMEKFRILTSVFPAVIPDVEYGRSVKDFLEMPSRPGNYPAVVDGYFVMLQFDTGSYYVHSWASGPRDRHGSYFSQLLYQLEVSGPRTRRGTVTNLNFKVPSRNKGIIQDIIFKKQQTGELLPSDITIIKKMAGI